LRSAKEVVLERSAAAAKNLARIGAELEKSLALRYLAAAIGGLAASVCPFADIDSRACVTTKVGASATR
jgi:hypothetical protein